MLRHFNRPSLLAIHQVVTAVPNSINILAPHHASNLGILIPLPECFSLFRIIVTEVQYIIGSAAFVRISDLILGLHALDPLVDTVLLLLHIFPSLQISLIFLDPKK